MKKLISLILILALCTVSVYAGSFKDVSSSYWAYDVIEEAYQLGIIKGYGAGKFKPEVSVDKQQTIVMLYRTANAAGLVSEEEKALLPELVETYLAEMTEIGLLNNAEFREAVAYCLYKGFISVSDIGANGAGKSASRELIELWAGNILGFETSPLAVLTFTDTANLDADKMQMADAMYRAGIMQGSTNGKLDPKGNLQRAHISAVAVRMLKYVSTPQADTAKSRAVSVYGKLKSVNTERNTMAIDTASGARTLHVEPGTEFLYEGTILSLSDLGTFLDKGLTFSAVIGADKKVLVQSRALVVSGKVTEVSYGGDYNLITISSSDQSFSYLMTSETSGSTPSVGEAVSFISDGAFLLEIN